MKIERAAVTHPPHDQRVRRGKHKYTDSKSILISSAQVFRPVAATITRFLMQRKSSIFLPLLIASCLRCTPEQPHCCIVGSCRLVGGLGAATECNGHHLAEPVLQWMKQSHMLKWVWIAGRRKRQAFSLTSGAQACGAHTRRPSRTALRQLRVMHMALMPHRMGGVRGLPGRGSASSAAESFQNSYDSTAREELR